MNRLHTLLAVSIFALAQMALADGFSGRVVRIKDGDTIAVLNDRNQEISVRMHQIDAPEKRQAFGQRSKQSLSDLVYGKVVSVEMTGDKSYERPVGTIFVNGVDINKEQVRRGMAWASTKYVKDPSLFTLEKDARQQRIGLWVDPNPIPPWEFRWEAKQARQ